MKCDFWASLLTHTFPNPYFVASPSWGCDKWGVKLSPEDELDNSMKSCEKGLNKDKGQM
jgi:hypothetical protein